MKKKTRAVVFDLYGTLIHVRDDRKAFKRLLNELGGRTPEGEARAKKVAFIRYFSDLGKMADAISPGHTVDLGSYEKEIFDELGRAECFSETPDVLSHLRKKGMALGLISNVLIPYERPFFDLGLRKLFDEYIFSCECGLVKPDPEIYRMMLGKLGMDPGEVLMVGDSPYCDVHGPEAVGMNAVLLDRSSRSNSKSTIRTLEGIYPLIRSS